MVAVWLAMRNARACWIAFLAALALAAIAIGYEWPNNWKGYAVKFSPVVFFAWFLIGIYSAAFKTINADREKAAKDLYATNQSARVDRAHHVFYHLYRRGQTHRGGTLELRQAWDRDMMKALSQVAPSLVQMYLLNTGRGEDSTVPLQDERFESALNLVDTWLREDFHRVRL